MGRPAKFTGDQMLDAARSLLAAGGPAGVSMQGVAVALNAPSGSVYHRFAGRDVLLGSLWLRSIERFHSGLFAELARPDPFVAARRGAAHVLAWSRAYLDDARILLAYRSSDLLTAGWPAQLQDRDARQRARLESALKELGHRLGATDQAGWRRLRFAVIDIPYAAVRESLQRGVAPEPELTEMVDTAVFAVLSPFATRGVSE
jgi:AcrR family transcriptional regulator